MGRFDTERRRDASGYDGMTYPLVLLVLTCGVVDTLTYGVFTVNSDITRAVA